MLRMREELKLRIVLVVVAGCHCHELADVQVFLNSAIHAAQRC
jgi:hypothetical protein